MTKKEIIDEIANKHGSDISKLHEYYLGKYESSLESAQIVEAHSLKSRRSTLLKIIYEVKNNIQNEGI